MRTFKICLLTFALCLLTFQQTKAQDDANAGIYVDGTFVDSVKCWTFGYMYHIFPIREKFNKYEQIMLYFATWYTNNVGETVVEEYKKEFSPEAFSDNFGDAQYGVWKFLVDKETDEKYPTNINKPWPGLLGVRYRRHFACHYSKDDGGKGWKCADYKMIFRVYGGRFDGYKYDPAGNKIVNYKYETTLYESNIVPVDNCQKCKMDYVTPCVVTGKKMELNIEKSLAYKAEYGIIKGNPSKVKVETTNTTPTTTEKTTTTKTDPDKNRDKTNTVTKTNTATNASSAGPAKPLDKTKPGYFAEKDGAQIAREGYKKGDALNGEVRVYTEGKIREISFYVNDKKNGPSTTYFDNGKIEMSGNMKDDEKDGEWKFYTEEGKLRESKKYLNGEVQD